MIADVEGGCGGSDRQVVVALPAAAHDALLSVAAVTQMAEAVGKLAVDHGIGQPLTTFQTLMKTYQTLAQAQAALYVALQHFLGSAEPAP